MAMTTEEAVRIAAVAGAYTDKQVAAAKAALPDDSHHPIDFAVQLNGVVTKGKGSADIEYDKPATVNLLEMAIVAEVVRVSGLEPAELRRVLLRAGRNADKMRDKLEDPNTPHAGIAAVFVQTHNKLIGELPTTKATKKGRRGSVSVAAVPSVLVKNGRRAA